MEPDPKRIVVRYKKLGRERVLGLADFDTYEILIGPQGLSRGGMRESYFVGLLKMSHFGNAFCSSAI